MSNSLQCTVFDEKTCFTGPIPALLASHVVATDIFYIISRISTCSEVVRLNKKPIGYTFSDSIFNFNFYYNVSSDIIVSSLLKNPKRNLQHVLDSSH